MSPFLIYGLVDPRTNEVRYIGKSASGLERPKQHTMPSFLRNVRTHKANWVRSLLALGLEPSIVVLEDVGCKQDAADVECFWIAQARGLGWPLTNLTKGGDGVVLWARTPEHNAKIGNALRGRKQPAPVVAKMAAASKQRAQTPEGIDHVRRAAAALWGRPAERSAASERTKAAWDDPEKRSRMLAKRPKTHTEMHKRRIGDASKKSWQDPEYRAKVLAARTGKKLSPEHRAKLSAAARKRYAK